MACGCHVALSRSSSLPEAGGEAGCYFDPNDTADVRRKLAGLLRGPERRRRMTEAGDLQARKFDLERTAAGYTGLPARLRNRNA